MLAVELSRLYHVPWLDDFRRSTAGALTLGRIFSPWNFLAYPIGIVAARTADGYLFRRGATLDRSGRGRTTGTSLESPDASP